MFPQQSSVSADSSAGLSGECGLMGFAYESLSPHPEKCESQTRPLFNVKYGKTCPKKLTKIIVQENCPSLCIHILFSGEDRTIQTPDIITIQKMVFLVRYGHDQPIDNPIRKLLLVPPPHIIFLT